MLASLAYLQTVASILNDFMETFQVTGTNGSLTKKDLFEYFSNTATFVTDDFFKDMMSSIWKKGFIKTKHAPIEGSLAAFLDPSAVKKQTLEQQTYTTSASGEKFSNDSFIAASSECCVL